MAGSKKNQMRFLKKIAGLRPGVRRTPVRRKKRTFKGFKNFRLSGRRSGILKAGSGLTRRRVRG